MKTLPIEKYLQGQEEAIDKNVNKIEDRVQELENKKAGMQNQLSTLKEKKNILIDVMEDPDKELIKKAMEKTLCHGHITYCCASQDTPLSDRGKNCPFRNSLLQALGLTTQDYEDWKLDGSQHSFWNMLQEEDII